jgi:hypothetical protein
MKNILSKSKLGLAVLFLAITSSTLLAAPPRSGIEGHASLYISYGTPIEVSPCEWVSVGDLQLPVATSFKVLLARPGHRNGREVGHFSTDADGDFAVALPPGKYIIVPDPINIGAAAFPDLLPTDSFEVTVQSRKFTSSLILYYQDGPLTIFSAPLQ